MSKKMEKVLKVSGKTNPGRLAGALVMGLKENGGEIHLQAVGAGAVNQAVKAVSIARGMSAPSGQELFLIPSFVDVEIEDRSVTAVQFKVKVA